MYAHCYCITANLFKNEPLATIRWIYQRIGPDGLADIMLAQMKGHQVVTVSYYEDDTN